MRTLLVLSLLFASAARAEDSGSLRAQVLALSELTEAPVTYEAPGFEDVDAVRPLFFEALSYEGEPTRAFAYLGLPAGASADGKVPAVVLVHGGGGTAFCDWVAKWNARGYAAISIAVEGQTDVRDADKKWERHDHSGPARVGIYGDSDKALSDQWMYHAVADTILANSLLRALPEVDAEKVGIMGISWGGIITSTVMGIDDRFVFAIPTYGCGNLAEAPNQYGRALGKNAIYKEVWDPMLRLERATMPALWLSWTGDQHFPLQKQAACYHAAPGIHMLSLIPNMRHGHAPGWNPEDSYAFADSVLKEGKPWCVQTGVAVDDHKARVRFAATKPIDSAVLTYTTDPPPSGSAIWLEAPATLRIRGGTTVAEATIPAGTTTWFFLLKSGSLHACSDLQE